MYLETFKQRLIALKLVKTNEFVGCTHQEVTELEQQLEVKLPSAYKEFLLMMGKGAGSFLRGSDCFYRHIPNLQPGAVELLEENNFPETLPPDAFVFFMHQGYQFSFFRLLEGENPTTYSYHEGKNQTYFIKSYDKFSDFLLTELELHEKYLMNLKSE